MSCKTDTWDYWATLSSRLSCILKDRFLRLLSDLEFAMSCILKDRYLRFLSDLEFEIELYLVRQIPEIIERPGVWDWDVSCKTDTWDYWATWSSRWVVSCKTDSWDYWATLSSRWVVSWKTDTWDYWATWSLRLRCILKDRYLRLLYDLEFEIELYLVRQIPEIIERPGVWDWVVSCKTDSWDYWATWSLRLSCIL